ncbi:MAG: DUF3472 domain-containing protein, partial [Clostridiales bacterium]|nr:DUF3472 domain-containing protein [Clostridiales bacterium]
MKKIIISIVLVLALLVSFPAVPAFSYSAPAVYVDWNIGGTADVLSVDWRCTTDSVSTYWAVSQFDDGYAGFQTLGNGQHVIIMSLWNLNNNTTKPTVEYAKDNNGADFGGEGEGKKVITSYNWKVGTWYTMRIQLRREGGKSYYEQWVREGNGPWEITAVISYPVSNRTFRYVLAFQEDFWDSGPNKRSAEVKNAYARMINTGAWKSLNRYELSNYGSALNRNTYWALVSNGTAVSFAAGGNTTPASGQTNPQFFTVNQPASPAETSWLPKLPPGGVPISRVRVNSWETSSPDKYTARCLFDGNENTFWHAKWSQGSGSIGKGEAFVDIDLGSVKT